MADAEIQNYLRILEAVPTNMPAFEALKQIFQENERWADLAKLYEDRANRHPDRSQAPDLYLEAAGLWSQRVKDNQRAKQAITKVLEQVPNQKGALALWRQIALNEGDFATAIKILRQETQITDDNKQKSARFVEIAKIFENHLNNRDHAGVAFHQAFLLDTSNADAMNQALRLYKEVGKWQNVIQVLRARLESLQDKAQRARLLFEIGSIFLHHLDEGKTPEGQQKAQQLFNEALALDPKLTEAKEAIEEIAFDVEDWGNLLKRLKKDIRTASDSGDNERAAFFNYKIAEGYYKREDKPTYAVRYCKQALEILPTYQKALNLLQELYTKMEKWEALADFFAELAKISNETDVKVSWLKKLAALYREQTKEREREIETLERILDIDAAERETLRQLESIYRDEGRFGKALAVMEKRLAILETAFDQKNLLLEMARVAHDELSQSTKAAAYYEQILGIDENDLQAIDALLPIYQAEGQWEKLIRGLNRKLDRTEDKRDRASFLTQIGDIYSHNLSLSKEAFDSYTKALRENPQDDALTQKLESLARQIGNWEDMIDLYKNTLENAEDPADQAALFFRIGDIYERELGDRDKAKSSYEEAIEQHPHLDAMNALQRIYRSAEEWVELAELLKEKSKLEQISEAQKIEVLEELARIQQNNIDDLSGAAQAYELILQLSATHSSALESLEQIYKQTENWTALRGVYQRRVDNPSSEEELQSTLHILGSLLIERLNDLENAVQIYQQLRVLDGQNSLILSRLEQLYRDLEQWEQWVDTARHRAENIRRPDQKKEVLFEIAQIQENKLSQPTQAITTLREIHFLDDSDLRVLDELERLLDDQDDVEGQLDILRKKVNLQAATNDKKQLLFRMANLHRTLQQEESMGQIFREILGLDANDLKALRALQGFHQTQGDHEEVLSLLLRERDAVAEAAEKTALSQRVAQLETVLGRFEEAISEYRSLLKGNPEDEVARTSLETIAKQQADWRVEALQVLEPIYRASNNWAALVQSLEARFESIGDKRVRLQVARELEEIYRLRLGDDERAFHWSCQILREDFQNQEMRERVEMMADEMGRWNELLSIYEDIVRSFVEPRQIVDTYLFIAQSYQERLKRPEDALRNYRRVLDYDQNNVPAVDALEMLFRQLEQWRDLVDILRMRVAMTEEADEKKELLFEVADLWEERLQDPPEAIQVFSDILDLQRDNLTAIRRLAALYERESRYTELAELWERELELLPAGEEVLSLRYRLGCLYLDHLYRTERALELFQQVLEAKIQHAEAIQRVEALIDNDFYRLICARILEPIYLHQANYAKLKTVYKIQLEDSSQSTEERRKALMRLGGLHEERLGEHREAFDRYLQVFKEAPGHPGTRDALLRMTEKLEAWRELINAFESGVTRIDEIQERVQTHLVLAKLYRERLKDADKGMHHDRRIVDDLDPRNLQAIEALETYYSERQSWTELIDILFQKEQALSDEILKKGVFNQVASIYEEQLNDNSQAILILKQYLVRLETQEEGPAPGEVELNEAKERAKALQSEVEELAETLELSKDSLSSIDDQLDDAKGKLEDIKAQLDADPENIDVSLENDRLVNLIRTLHTTQEAKKNEITGLEEQLEKAELADAEASGKVKEAEERMSGLVGQLQSRREQRIAFQLDTIQELSRLYEAESRWADLVEILEKEVKLLDDDGEALQLRFRIAKLWQDRLEDISKAISLYRDILNEDPDFELALKALEEISEQEDYQLMVAQSLESYFRDGRQDWVRLIEVVEIQLNHTGDSQDRLKFLKEIVALYEEELENTDMAFVYLCRAFREVPTDLDVISELERLAEENDAWEELVGVYEDEVEGISDLQLSLRMYLKIASIYDEALQDTDEAISNYRKALGLDEHNASALNALDRLYRQQKDWEALVDILQRKVRITPDTREQINLWSRIATIWEREISESTSAIDAYREILLIDPQNNNSLSALQRLYQTAERWEDLYEICKRKAELTDAASERGKLYKQIAKLCADHLSRSDEAIGLYEQVLKSNERDEESLTALEGLYARAERWTDLVDIVQRLLKVVTGVERKKEFFRTLGRTYGERLGQEAKSIEGWQRVLDLDPKDRDALEALRKIYEGRSEWENLVNILRRLIPLQTEPAEMLSIYLQLASIYQDHMNRVDDAITSWRRVLELDATNWRALDTLERLLSDRKDWRAVLGILTKKEAVVTDVFEKIDLLMNAARICKDSLREVNRSTPYYERILELDPTYLQAVQALAEIYSKNQDWKKLIHIYNLEVNLFNDVADKIAKLKAIAVIYENRLFNKTESFHTLLRAFECDPRQKELRKDLERIADEIHRWEELVRVFARTVDQIEEADEKIALLHRIGYIYDVQLREAEPAIAAYQGILAYDDNYLPALQALEKLYEQAERWNELIAIFQKKLLFSDKLTQQKDLLFRIAELYEYQIKDRVLAIETYQRLQYLDPEDEDVLKALENLYRQDGRWNELIQVLDRQIAQTTNQRELLKMKLEIGQIFERELEDPYQAIEAYRHILSVDGSNFDALRSLERLYTDLERWSELLETLERQVRITTKDEDKIPLYGRMALVWEEELQDRSQAIENLKKILDVDRWELSAIKALERLYRAAEEWDKLIEIYEQHIRAVDDREQMAFLYYEIGSIYEAYLGETDRAVTYYQRVLDADPFYQPALSSLGRLYEAAGNWPKCIEMMEREARVVNDPEKLVQVYFRIGKLYEERLVQIDRAKESYRKALEIQPGFLQALRSLKVILFLQRDWEGVVRLAFQQEQYTPDVGEKAVLFTEIGKLYKERLNNPGQAASCYTKALELQPGYVQAAKPLADIYIDQKQWPYAEAVLDMLIQVLQQQALTDDLYLYHYQMALATENQQNIQKALYHYQEAYNLNTNHFPTLNGLGRIYYAQQEWDRSLKVYQAILYSHRSQLSERELSEVYYRMGLAYDQMGSLEQAVEYYERALEIDPANPFAIRRMADYAEQRGEWAKAVELKERLLLILESESDRFELLLNLAQLAYERLGRPDQAVGFYRQALLSSPDNIQILYRLLELYELTQSWYEMIETLEQLIQLEAAEPDKQLRYTHNIAEIYQHRIQDIDNASLYYNRVLDLNPSYEAAFQALEAMLYGLERWLKLDEAYRAMLQRIPAQDPAAKDRQLALWIKLGDLHRYKLDNIDNAVAAYEIVYQLDPSVKNLETLADLYSLKDIYRPKAVEIQHKLLLLNPARIESYKALIRLYYELQQFDRSFSVCSTLRFLQQASAEEEQFYKSMKEKAPDRITRAFREDETWKQLLAHPMAKNPLADILTILYQFCGAEFAKSTKDFKIKKTDKVDANLFFSRTYEYVAKVLNLQVLPEVYQTNIVQGLRLVNTFPPVILAGEDMFKERHPKELLFMIARQLTFSRPEFLFASVLSYAEFRALLSSFFHLYNPSFPLDIPEETASAIKKRIVKGLPQESQNRLNQLVQAYFQNPVQPDTFLEGIEHTANRVGFCLAGELNIASKVCEREGRDDFKVHQRTKVKELVLYSVSEEYFTFRDKQGLAVKP